MLFIYIKDKLFACFQDKKIKIDNLRLQSYEEKKNRTNFCRQKSLRRVENEKAQVKNLRQMRLKLRKESAQVTNLRY